MPEIVTALTAHPAFAKACHVLGIRQTRVAVDATKRLDVDALRAAVSADTVMLVASAPCYPYGVVDPVEAVAALADERGLLCHVDACLGGLILPFWERLGEPVPLWDFRVRGVTSISADIHKYGYSYKGASALLWRDAETAYKRAWFADGVWGGGMYATATTAGTRPAPPIAGRGSPCAITVWRATWRRRPRSARRHEQVAERLEEYHSLGIEHAILSGQPHLEEAYWFGEGAGRLLRGQAPLAQRRRGAFDRVVLSAEVERLPVARTP